MSRTETFRQQLANALKKEADAHKEAAKLQGEINRHIVEGNKKSEQAARASNLNSMMSYVKQSEGSQKKALDFEKKLSVVKSKQAAIAAEKVTIQRNLEASEKADRDKLARERNTSRATEIFNFRIKSSVREKKLSIAPAKPEPLRVLYLTSNPDTAQSPLRTDAEVRSVQNALKATKFRDLVDVEFMPAATYEDMLSGLNEKRPHVVHFSGHGWSSGLVFDNGSVENPSGVNMGFDKLARLLAATDTPPKLLVLNACETLIGADVLLDAVPVVVGMSEVISDNAAVTFATKFYSAIANAQSVDSALKQAMFMLSMLDIPEDHIPQCVTRDDMEIDRLVLVTPEVPATVTASNQPLENRSMRSLAVGVRSLRRFLKKVPDHSIKYLDEAVDDLNEYILRLQTVPLPVRKFLGAVATRVNKIKTAGPVTYVDDGVRIAASDLEVLSGMSPRKIFDLATQLEMYGLGCYGEPDIVTPYAFVKLNGLGDCEWNVWPDIAAFCDVTLLPIERFTQNLEFDRLD